MNIDAGFPAFFYHPKHEVRIFKTSKELSEAGEGWVDTPEKFPKEGDVPADVGHGGPINEEKPKKQRKQKEVKA